MTTRRVAGIILAAGASRRFGSPKQLLPVNGQPLLQGAIDTALASTLSDVLLVLGSSAEAIIDTLALRQAAEQNDRFGFIVANDWQHGASASLRAGLDALPDDCRAAAILLGDQPGMTSDIIDTVLAAFAASDLPIARPVYGDALEPGHPVVIDRRLFADLTAIEGDAGARQLLAERADDVLQCILPGNAPRDIDTPEDYSGIKLGPAD